MMKRAAFALLAALFASAYVGDASAQFADQATYVGAGAGTANAQTITLPPQATSLGSINGVLIKYIPANSNTGAATINPSSLGTTAVEKPSAAGLVALTGSPSELVASQPALVMYTTACTCFVLMSPPTSVLTVAAVNLANSALGLNMPPNLQITPTVGSNQLTISVCATGGSATACNSGNNATSTNPIPFVFRDVTIANGDPVVVPLQASQSITIGSGNTLGCTNGVACRLRIYEINNGGTLALCIYNSLSGTNIVGLNEGSLQSSFASTTGGSSAQTLYCSTASVSAKAIREIGYVEVTESTAGTWASLPTYTQLMGPGVKKAGDIVQGPLEFVDTTAVTCSTTVNTPTDTAQSIVPSSAANVIHIHASESIEAFGGTNPQTLAQISRGSGPTLIGNQGSWKAINGGSVVNTTVAGTTVSLEASDVPNSTSSLTYTVYVQATVSGGCHSNPSGLGTSAITLWEVESALENAVPDNDNVTLKMVG